ncbi:hypothetical protein BCM40_08185 [Planococcus donghaensis]|uniref:Integrase n=1 Tax=Planococcus donghaensis TaxID=414778 RepID=A0A1C7EHK2_9BACL|nr:hypothetical protein BCM40_08185 [Planococcus donghaensis]
MIVEYRIIPTVSFSEKIGELVTMLKHIREVTLIDVANLSQSDLDYRHDESSNSIGSLLLHIASIEFVHQIVSSENRDLTADEYIKWKSALELGAKAREDIKGHTLAYYLNELHQVRQVTLTLLKSKQDNWLAEEKKWGNGIPHNNYYLWFHVLEEEISHRGQIRMIMRLLRNNDSNL